MPDQPGREQVCASCGHVDAACRCGGPYRVVTDEPDGDCRRCNGSGCEACSARGREQEPLPVHVESNYSPSDGLIHLVGPDYRTRLASLTPDQAEEVAGYLLNHATNRRRNDRPPATAREQTFSGSKGSAP